jgi:hypothetical protein
MPYAEKPLRAWLRERGIGRLTVKKRHYPKEPETIRRELKLSGKGEEAALVLVRQERGWLAVLCAGQPAVY